MNKSKIIAIIAIIIGVVGLAIGFATFSSTLTISSSANVNPSSSDFSVVLSSASDSTSTSVSTSNYSASGGATATTTGVTVSETSISGLNASFTEPGQSVFWTFYARNVGEYAAYLNNITGGTKTCTAGSGATQSLVNSACNGISIEPVVFNNSGINKGQLVNSTFTKNLSEALATESYDMIFVQIKYASGSARADGPFTVNFGTISIGYGSTSS